MIDALVFFVPRVHWKHNLFIISSMENTYTHTLPSIHVFSRSHPYMDFGYYESK